MVVKGLTSQRHGQRSETGDGSYQNTAGIQEINRLHSTVDLTGFVFVHLSLKAGTKAVENVADHMYILRPSDASEVFT